MIEPVALVLLGLALVFYCRGILSLRQRDGRLPSALPWWRAAAFAAGVLTIATLLLSPLHALSGGLLTVHMTQHVLLIAVAPPLLALGRPGIACFRGLPSVLRRRLALNRFWRGLGRRLDAASRPLPATIFHAAALWIWHVPALFEAARADDALHWLEHLCFFGTAMLFWHGLVRAARSPAASLAGMAAALATLVHGGFLSALIALSPTTLYPTASAAAPLWGLSPLQDQQLAGVIMWVPAGAAYLVAGLLLAARLLTGQPAAVGKRRPSPA